MTSDSGFSRFRLGGVALLIVSATSIALLWGHQRSTTHGEADALREAQAAGPRVRVATAGANGEARVLTLPGDAMPFESTTIFAKVSGFLREIRVDKGSSVRKGEVLAVLESTEVDADAKALLADAKNKRRYADRVHQLRKEGIISDRDLEDAEAAARIAEEKLASQAVVQGYRNVTAPFAGVVTQRFADPGALIQNGGNSTATQPIVSLAQVGRLRVAFYVDQQVASRIKVGQEIKVCPTDRPDLMRTVSLARLAGALDTRTRTLLAEADLDNRDGAFVAGGSVQVSLTLPREAGRLEIPSEAVLLKGDKAFAAVVGADRKVTLRPVMLGEDTGSRVRVLQGLQGGEKVVLNAPTTLKDGDRVQAVDVPA
jgi:RND family efflux transporter MFP subunit